MNLINSRSRSHSDQDRDPEKAEHFDRSHSRDHARVRGHDQERDRESERGGGFANLAHDLDLDPTTSERIAAYRVAVGIASTPSMTTKGGTSLRSRVATNQGFYPRVVRAERSARIQYHTASKIINVCLGLQIIVAAALTALGAADRGSSAAAALGTVITVLGAINTIIAGFLTYLKGSSLPNRYKYYEHEWRRVRELIEQRERDLINPSCKIDLWDAVEEVERAYKEVKSDIENSAPDGFVSPSKMRRKDEEAEAAMPPRVTTRSMSEGGFRQFQSRIGDTVQGVAREAEARLEKAAENIQAQGKEAVEDGVDSVKKTLHDRLDKI